jgi:hypothetical protein
MRATLAKVREDLLDLGLRNPLLNYRLLKTRGLQVQGIPPATIYYVPRHGRSVKFADYYSKVGQGPEM